MDWKSVAAIVAGACAIGVPALSLAGKWLEIWDARWKARAIAAEKSKAELEETIRGLESNNAALQKQIEDLKARPSAETIFPPDVPPGTGFIPGF